VPIGPGTRLGSYVVQDFIGQGAMGVVYRAYHAQLERTGAVKVLQGLGGDLDSTARFRREAQAIARMRHPNVLNVFDFGEFEGTPYMIVEYVEGGSLAPRVKSGPLDRGTAIAFLRGIGEALDYAHKHGIVHRDVKPANVLLGPDDNPILADFGLAKLMESSSIKSLTGVTTGTPAYMAPEQVTGSQVGPAADRYSLAVMAYEMLTGSLPFDEGGVLEVLYAHVHKEPAPPSMLDHRLSPKVDAVIMRGMSKEPAARWERCRDFVAALESALNPAPAAVEKTVAFVPPPQPPQAPKPSPVHRPARPAAEMTAVMAADEAAGPIRGPDPALPFPVVTWKGAVVPGHATSKRSRGRLALVVGAILLIVLLLAATGAYLVTRPPSLTLSRYAVSPGERITVTATHLPPDQLAEIWILSNPYIYSFRADAIGRATRDVVIPLDIDGGDHTLRICWGGSCPLSTTLRVNVTVALETPTSSPPTPSPTHSTTTSPTPAQTPAPSASLVSVSASLNTTVRFSNFTGSSTTLEVCQDAKCYTPLIDPVTITSGTATFKTPVGIKPTSSAQRIGLAYVLTGCCGRTTAVVVTA
jgi:serine/threonine protein kinase, bacterial